MENQKEKPKDKRAERLNATTQASKPASEASKVLHAPMATVMKVDFLFNRDGGVWLLHDQPLPDILKWVEFDADLETVTLVTEGGKLQDLGIKIPSDMSYYIENAMELTTMLVKDGKVADFAIVPMLTRNTITN